MSDQIVTAPYQPTDWEVAELTLALLEHHKRVRNAALGELIEKIILKLANPVWAVYTGGPIDAP